MSVTTEDSQSQARIEELENLLDLSKAKAEVSEEKSEQLQLKVDELETKNGNFKVETKA